MRRTSPTSWVVLVALGVLGAAPLRSLVPGRLDGGQAATSVQVPTTQEPTSRAAASAHARSVHPVPALVRTTLEQYCLGCHDDVQQTGGLSLDSVDFNDLSSDLAVWEKVATKLRTGEMPPAGEARPYRATAMRLVTQLELALDQLAASRPQPGRVPVHRLNRAEYAAAVRDLLGLEVDPKTLLAADEAEQEGFDNMASVLSVSPALLENYLAAARRISRLAVGDVTVAPGFETFKIPKLLVQDEQMSDDLPFGSRGGAHVNYQFPVDGDYVIKALLRRQEYDYIVGLGEAHQLDFRLDGVRVGRISIGGEAKGRTMPESYVGNTQGDPDFERYLQTADAKLEVRVPVKAGRHDVGVSFVGRRWEPEGVWQPPIIGFGRATNELYHGNPTVEVLMIGGPYGTVAPGDSTSRNRLFSCRPKTATEEEPCARQILSGVATRAYRRPATPDDIGRVMDLYRAGRQEGGDFEHGIQRGLERILASPSFLFRVEPPPAGLAPGTPYRLRGYELASRLSFFLWSSVPDDELLALAASGQLEDDRVVERQVRRMLKDHRAQALVSNFASRWLELGRLAGVVPDTDLYREFDENLRTAMDQETRLFVADQIRRDQSVLDLVGANYSFLNERLATHYGVPHVYGDHFRKVVFTDGRRGGLLGQGSLLTITSYPNRTSVVVRGRWVLANLLGAPPPAPPPDVPALQEPGANGAPRSLRERMEAHRANPACAICHRRMDPMGFALENYDATGKWRTESDGVPIDATATLPDGTRFNGVEGLRAMMLSHKDDLIRTVTGKLLAYAIGRGLEPSDVPAVRGIMRDASRQEYRWSAIVAGIVRSTPFRMSVVPETESGPQPTRVDSRNR